jgi:hypothetical protein
MPRVLSRAGALATGSALLAALAVAGPLQATAGAAPGSGAAAVAADDVDCIPLGTRSGTIATSIPFSWTDQQCRSVYMSDRRIHVIRVKQLRCPYALPSVRARATAALPGGYDRDEQTKKADPCPTFTLVVMGTMRADVQLSIMTQPGDQTSTTVIKPI